MMKRLLKNKTGVTILEGLIALGLLALVAGGTFGVLLSVSRKASQPDIREEMLFAVERASELLQLYTNTGVNEANVPEDFRKGLCKESSSFSSVLSGTHQINCMLPAICDRENGKSSFSYSVSEETFSPAGFPSASNTTYREPSSTLKKKKISFNIKCNGFTL